jgi:hypothetical protein
MEGELDTAIIEHHAAADAARDAAREAEIAAAIAIGASSAQANLVSSAMEAGRQDSKEAAIEAKAAANEAEAAASDAININAALLGQFQLFHEEIMRRLDAVLEEVRDSKEPAPAPVVVGGDADVQTISPDVAPEEGAEEEETPAPKKSSRKVGKR